MVVGKVRNKRFVFRIYDLGNYWYKVVKPLDGKKHKQTSGTLFKKSDFKNQLRNLYAYLAKYGYKKA